MTGVVYILNSKSSPSVVPDSPPESVHEIVFVVLSQTLHIARPRQIEPTPLKQTPPGNLRSVPRVLPPRPIEPLEHAQAALESLVGHISLAGLQGVDDLRPDRLRNPLLRRHHHVVDLRLLGRAIAFLQHFLYDA